MLGDSTRLALIGCALTICGCQHPLVTYQTANGSQTPSEDVDAAAKAADALVFSVPYSTVAVREPKPPERGASGTDRGNSNKREGEVQAQVTPLGSVNTKPFEAEVVPVEGDDFYRVAGVSNFWSMTSLSVERMANTDIPTNVQVAFTDLMPSRIQSLVSLGGSIAQTFSPASGDSYKQESCDASIGYPPSYLFRLDPPNLEALQGNGLRIPSPTDPTKFSCWMVHMSIVGLGYDTLSRNAFQTKVKREKQGIEANFFPVASCVTGDLRIDLLKEGEVFSPIAPPKLAGRLKLIDPKSYRLVRLPEKGQIEMHPVCGANTTNEPSDHYKPYFDAATAALGGSKPSTGAQDRGDGRGGTSGRPKPQ